MLSFWFILFLLTNSFASSVNAFLDSGCAESIHQPKFFSSLSDICLKSLFTLDRGNKRVFGNLPKRIYDWGSNGKEGLPWHFEETECDKFFIDLLFHISSIKKDIYLSPHDLFHGHLINYGKEEQKNLAIVVHAKEYPADLELIKNRYQVIDERFLSDDKNFKNRNFLILVGASNNDVYVIHDQGSCQKYFSKQGINTLSEKKIAKTLNGIVLGDFNMFQTKNIGRIKYKFYAGINMASNRFVYDLESYDSGKSLCDRMITNVLMEQWIARHEGQNIIYFLTGLK
jgi:hypothetical protein